MEYKISKSIFTKETVLKVVYLWQVNFTIVLSEDEYNYIISVSDNITSNFDLSKFSTDLQEQQLRETLNSQFGSLRDAIYGKAFEKIKG